MVKVVKFGGSSLASAEQFRKVADIIHSDESRRYVVPSAPGKRFSADTKVTDMLYGCYELAAKGKNFDKEFEAIKERYYSIIKELNIDIDMEKEFDFTISEIINKANLMCTPTQLGKLLNTNVDLLEQEGLHITKYRTTEGRMYHIKYEEPSLENE